jgi:hypothetical protein
MMNNFLRKGLIPLKALLLIFFLLSFCLGDVNPAHSFMLLTPEESALAEAPAALSPVEKTPLIERKFMVPESTVEGPEIRVLLPEAEKAYPSPLKVLVKFVPREGTQVDISSLKVECLKIFVINLTDRMKEYISNQGINMDKAELPTGTHKIRVTLGDTGGGITSKVFVVKVQ